MGGLRILTGDNREQYSSTHALRQVRTQPAREYAKLGALQDEHGLDAGWRVSTLGRAFFNDVFTRRVRPLDLHADALDILRQYRVFFSNTRKTPHALEDQTAILDFLVQLEYVTNGHREDFGAPTINPQEQGINDSLFVLNRIAQPDYPLEKQYVQRAHSLIDRALHFAKRAREYHLVGKPLTDLIRDTVEGVGRYLQHHHASLVSRDDSEGKQQFAVADKLYTEEFPFLYAEHGRLHQGRSPRLIIPQGTTQQQDIPLADHRGSVVTHDGSYVVHGSLDPCDVESGAFKLVIDPSTLREDLRPYLALLFGSEITAEAKRLLAESDSLDPAAIRDLLSDSYSAHDPEASTTRTNI